MSSSNPFAPPQWPVPEAETTVSEDSDALDVRVRDHVVRQLKTMRRQNQALAVLGLLFAAFFFFASWSLPNSLGFRDSTEYLILTIAGTLFGSLLLIWAGLASNARQFMARKLLKTSGLRVGLAKKRLQSMSRSRQWAALVVLMIIGIFGVIILTITVGGILDMLIARSELGFGFPAQPEDMTHFWLRTCLRGAGLTVCVLIGLVGRAMLKHAKRLRRTPLET